MVTKIQVLAFLQQKQDLAVKDSIKYYTIGALRILVSKDIITVADITAQFPELA